MLISCIISGEARFKISAKPYYLISSQALGLKYRRIQQRVTFQGEASFLSVEIYISKHVAVYENLIRVFAQASFRCCIKIK